jgi:hypothetical protein
MTPQEAIPAVAIALAICGFISVAYVMGWLDYTRGWIA